MSSFRQAFKHIHTLPSVFWIVIAATLMNQFGNMAFVFIVLYLTHQGFSLTEASSAFATFAICMFTSSFVGGFVIDRLGAGLLMAGPLLFNGLVLLLFPTIHTYPGIILLCSLWGFTYGLYRPASQTFISQVSAKGLHKITFSVYRLAVNLGMSIGPALGGYLAGLHFNMIFFTNAAANLLASAILFCGLTKSGWLTYRASSTLKPVFRLNWLKQNVLLRLFILGIVPANMIFYQHGTTLSVFLKNDLHLSMSFYGLLFTLNTLIIVCCELPLNIITLKWSYRFNCMVGSFFIALGFTGYYFAKTPEHVVLLSVLWTIGEMVLFPAASSYLADIAPADQRGRYMSVYSTCSNLGLFLGPWLGALAMQYGGAQSLWLVCAAWGILSIAAFNYLQEPANELAMKTS